MYYQNARTNRIRCSIYSIGQPLRATRNSGDGKGPEAGSAPCRPARRNAGAYQGECLEIRGADFGQLFEVEAKPAPEWLWPFAPQSSRRSRQQVGQRAGQSADPDDNQQVAPAAALDR